MQPISKIDEESHPALYDGPSIDRVIDNMLTAKYTKNGEVDPLAKPFPSLGFANESGGSYFKEITQGDMKVTLWRLTGAFNEPDTFRVQLYHKVAYNDIVQWRARSQDRLIAESLLHAQAIIHHFFTSGGNDDLER